MFFVFVFEVEFFVYFIWNIAYSNVKLSCDGVVDEARNKCVGCKARGNK